MGEPVKALLSYDHINVTVDFTVYAQSVGDSHRTIEKVVLLLEKEHGVTVDSVKQVISQE